MSFSAFPFTLPLAANAVGKKGQQQNEIYRLLDGREQRTSYETFQRISPTISTSPSALSLHAGCKAVIVDVGNRCKGCNYQLIVLHADNFYCQQRVRDREV